MPSATFVCQQHEPLLPVARACCRPMLPVSATTTLRPAGVATVVKKPGEFHTFHMYKLQVHEGWVQAATPRHRRPLVYGSKVTYWGWRVRPREGRQPEPQLLAPSCLSMCQLHPCLIAHNRKAV
jgi:hypothetical protein